MEPCKTIKKIFNPSEPSLIVNYWVCSYNNFDGALCHKYFRAENKGEAIKYMERFLITLYRTYGSIGYIDGYL